MALRIKRRTASSLLGIDFGSSAIKVVAVSALNGTFRLEAAASIVTPKGAIVEHQIVHAEPIATALQTLAKQLPASYSNVVTAVSGSHVITKIIVMEADLSRSDLELQVQLEAENSIPFPLEEISLDFEVLGASEGDPSRSNVLLSAARTESVTTRADVIIMGGFVPRIVDVESHALGRAWLLLLDQQGIDESQVSGLFELGANTLTFAVLNRGEVVYSRTQNFGSYLYTQRLATYYQLTVDEAERLRVNHELPVGHQVEVQAPYVSELLQQMRKQIQLFLSSSGYKVIDGFYLSGGGALLPRLVEQLEIELQQPVHLANPFADCDADPALNMDELKQRESSFMVALGLALRRLDNVSY